jgi:hypothetical protein
MTTSPWWDHPSNENVKPLRSLCNASLSGYASIVGLLYPDWNLETISWKHKLPSQIFSQPIKISLIFGGCDLCYLRFKTLPSNRLYIWPTAYLIWYAYYKRRRPLCPRLHSRLPRLPPKVEDARPSAR